MSSSSYRLERLLILLAQSVPHQCNGRFQQVPDDCVYVSTMIAHLRKLGSLHLHNEPRPVARAHSNQGYNTYGMAYANANTEKPQSLWAMGKYRAGAYSQSVFKIQLVGDGAASMM